jgi:hypothetical protein
MKISSRSCHVPFAFLGLLTVLCFNAGAGPTNCVPPPSGLVGWWPGENNANDIAGTNNGVLVGGTTFAQGVIGQAFSFDGTNNAVTNRVPGFTNILNTYSMEFWAWPTASRDTTPESTDGTDGDGGQRYAISPANGRFGPAGAGVSVGTNGVSVFEAGDAYIPALLVYDTPITNWAHIAVVYSNQQPSLYLNGVLVHTGLTSLRSSFPSTCFADGGFGYGFYAGLLDEVSIYNRALSGLEIMSIYNAASFGKCTPPVAPLLISQPTNISLVVGSNAVFAASAGGTPPLSYQWKFGGSNIAAATTNFLKLTNVQFSQAGLYSLQVTNPYGSTNSSNAILTVLPPTPPCATVPAGIVAWWRMETNGLDSVGTNNGTLTGAVNFVPGEVAAGLYLDNNQEGISVPDSPSLNFGAGADFSIEAWIQPLVATTDYGVMDIVDKRIAPNVSQGLGYAFYLVNGQLGVRVSASASANGFSAAGGPDLRDGKFHHVALTLVRNSTIGGQLYVDGVSVATFNPTSDSGDLTSSAPLLIGMHPTAGLDANFRGTIDEVSLYARALNAAEIQNIYNYGTAGKCLGSSPPFIFVQPLGQTVLVGSSVTFTVAADGMLPLSYQWAFQGTNLVGGTGTSLTLTNLQLNQTGNYSVFVSNAFGSVWSSNALLTVIPPPPCTTAPSNLVSWWRAETNAWDQVGGNSGFLSNNVTFAPAEVANGFVFNGAGAVVRIGNPGNLQLQDFTIEMWVRRTSSTAVSLNGNGNAHLFTHDNNGYGLYLDPTGHPVLTKVGINSVSSGASITDTNFHHVAVTKIGSAVVFYVDGIAYSAPSYNPGFTFPGSFWIGGIGNNYNFYGTIDEVSVYNRALTAVEIQNIYAALVSGKCAVPFAPFIVLQPTNQTVTTGSNVTLIATSGGTLPLAYQWKFKGTNIAGATSNVMVLPNIQYGQAGNYSIAVTNAAGFVLSSNAFLTVNFPPANVRIVNTNSASGGAVTVPVSIVANGNENALAFSLTFEPAKLGYTGVTLGTGAAGAFLITNTSLINSGKLGVSVAMPPGTTFNPGTQQVARVSFLAATLPTNAIATNTFGDQPTPRQLLDNQLSILPAFYSNGTVSVSAAVSYEGDVFPRPNGDTNTTLADWLMLGRYAARLDYPTNASEFQRADCAPRATLGDGAIKVTDWVQAGRYAAGFETLTPAGGPTNEQVTAGPSPSATRLLASSDATVVQGQSTSVSVTLTAQGNENALGFSLSFDPALVTFTSAALGAGGSGATLYVNSSQAASGRLGFALAVSTGAVFPAGTKELIRVTFQAAPAGSGGFSAAFGDLPVPREVSDAGANALPVSFINGNVTVVFPPALLISQAGTNVVLSWPNWANNFILQEAVATLPPGATWSNLPVTPINIGNSSTVTLPLRSSPRYYRLRSP